MNTDTVTWATNHGDTVEVYESTAIEGKGWLSGLRTEPCWRWRVRAANNRIVESGEPHTRKSAAIRAAKRHHPEVTG